MNQSSLEKEVKFYLSDLPALKQRLMALGAVNVQPRTREVNYRFDTPGQSLTQNGQVLRLRHDVHNILTYKGPSQVEGGVRVRPEYEVEVDDLDTARAILEGLGYVMTVSYEKWRSAWHYNDLEITLDELPYGNFSEIEGSDPATIQAAARVLSLDWELRIQASYLELFERLKQSLKLTLPHLSFQALANIPISPQDLGVKPADRPAYL